MQEGSGNEAALHEIITALRASGGAVSSSLVGETGGEDSCALCLLAKRSVERSLRAFFAEFVNDPQVRVQFRKARGFCREHTPFLAQLGDALGVSLLYADLADDACQRWRSGARGTRSNLLARLRGAGASRQEACPACRAEAEAEDRFASALAQGLEQARIWEALEASSGLCVRHVEQVAARARSGLAERLLREEAERLNALFIELEEFIRKNDYRFREEPWGPERDAWRRALLRLRRPS